MNVWKDKRLRLSITRLGFEYLAAMLLMGLFAVNTGNNLLYLVFSLMLGLFLASGWASRRAIQDLELQGLEEGNLFARVQGGIKVRLRDRAPGRVRGLEVHLALAQARVEPGFYPGGSSGQEQRLLVLQARPERRGPCRGEWLELRTSFPFGFLEKAWRFPLEVELLVLPHPRTSTAGPGWEGEQGRARPRPGSASPDGARPFKERDPLSRVHWKRTAQRGAPWVRTFEDEPPSGPRLRLDLRAWSAGPAFEKELEYLSGGIMRARLQRRDISLRVETAGGGREYQGYTPCWRALGRAIPEGDAFHAPGSALL
jgi:uncharacterized protein (DUF58 family)